MCKGSTDNERELKKCSDEAIISFISKKIKYPAIAREQGATGTAVVRFVVEKDGSMTDFKIVKDPGYGLGEEALRIAKKLPKWERSGSMKGRKVRVYFNLPIRFELKG